MHDIRSIRENPEAFDAGLARRGLEAHATSLIQLDEKRREILTELQILQARRNEASKEFGQLKSGQAPVRKKSPENMVDHLAEMTGALAIPLRLDTLQSELSDIKKRIPALEDDERKIADMLHAQLSSLPNIPLEDVPAGENEDSNKEVSRNGKLTEFPFVPQEHDSFGPALGLDFETGALLSGARFTLVRGPAARLARALGQFMLDTLTLDHGFEEVNPPLLVRDEAVYGTGQLPKFAEDLFRTTDGRWLIPTAEVSLTNIVREQILSADTLPLRFTALTPCFRSEAGAAGRDTRGYIRQHQFDKVEMVAIVTPDESEAEHERMTACAEDVLTKLALPFRRMKLCAGDMGFSAARTYDLEVWLPGQARYREISSVSTCTDFQARRMNARYRPEGEKGTRFLHTLNGSGLAVGRTLVAVLENYQQADGSVVVPEMLRPYLRGTELLEPKA